jgi:GT2 family glycosyltransferase
VVVPFAGTREQLDALIARLGRLSLRTGDRVVVVDNRRHGETPAAAGGQLTVVPAREQPGSYFARNAGAAAGDNPWIVFIDADVEPPASLLDDYLAGDVPERCGVLVGAVVDEPSSATAAARYADAKAMMSQSVTLRRPEFAYAQTANCAVRRAAFDAVGGFTASIRSGGDADLCFRLRDAGWGLEERPRARVVHRSRATLRALLRQRARVGAGARWLEERFPGFAPRRPLARALAGNAVRAARAAARREEVEVVDALADAAFQIGWRLPNRVGPR